MENPTEYEKTTAKDAYDPDVVSLLKARLDVEREMARIVMRVMYHFEFLCTDLGMLTSYSFR